MAAAPGGQGAPTALADRVPPVAMVVVGVTSIQFGAALARTLFDDLGAAGTSALRLVFAAAILLALARPRLRGRPRTDLRLVVAFGLVLGGMNFTFYEALGRIPLGVAVTVEFLGPLAVAVAGSRKPIDGVWVLLAGTGVVLLANPGGAGLDALGLLCALIAAALWGTYIVLAQRAGTRFTGSEGVALATAVAALVPLGPGIAEAGGALLSVHALVLGPVVGLLSSVVPYSLETEALRRIPRHVFGVLMSFEPGVGVLAGFLVLGQSLAARELVAVALVVTASVGAIRGAPPPPEA